MNIGIRYYINIVIIIIIYIKNQMDLFFLITDENTHLI